MSFIANVKAKLDDTELKQLDNLKGKTVDVKVNLTGDGANFIKEFSLQMNSMSSTALKSGRQVATMFNKGIKSIDKDSFYKEHFDEQKKMVAESQKLSKQYNVSEKNAMKAVEARKKAESNYAKEVEKRARLEQQTEDRWKKNLHDKEQARLKEERQTEERWLKNLHAQEQAQKKAKQAQEVARQKLEQETNDRWLKNLREQEQAQKSLVDGYSKIFSNGKYSADSKIYQSQIDKYANQETEALTRARNALKEYNDIRDDLQANYNGTTFVGIDDSILVQKFNAMETAATKYKNAMKEVASESTRTLKDGEAIVKSNEILTYYNNNTKAIKKYGQSLKDLAEDAKKAKTVADMDDINRRFKEIKTTISAEGLTGKSFLDDFKRAAGQIAQFTGIYGILQNVMQDIPRKMSQAVIDIDSAMTDLYKVTDETNSKYEEFLSTVGQTSKALGREASSYIEQTATWAKLGYNIDQSAELAKVSSVYSNVGDVDDKTAVSDLVTVMKAYNMGSNQAINIVDMLNELGNNYATDAASLGDGLKNVASTMAMSNTSLEKSLAILTGGSEITQNAGELGNAIKIAVLRLHGQKGKLEELGENADDIESVSKMQTQILNMTKGAVNIMDSADPTKFRDYYDVMADIAEVMPKLDNTTQANLIETLFGKNRANQGQAILQAFQSGQIQKAYETALNSTGSAYEEQNRWLESAEAKLQQFTSQFQTFSTVVFDDQIFKGVIDSGTGLLTLLTEIIDTLGLFPTVLGGVGIGAFVKNFA